MIIRTCYIAFIIHWLSVDAKSNIAFIPAMAPRAQITIPAAATKKISASTALTISQIATTAIAPNRAPLLVRSMPILASTTPPQRMPMPPVAAAAPTATQQPKQILAAAQMIRSTPKPTIKVDANALYMKWKHLLKNPTSFIEITTFIAEHPTLPKQITLREKAERIMSDPGTDPIAINQIINFFDRYNPQTGRGQFYYAKALLTKGKIDQAKQEFYKLLESFSIPVDIIAQLPNYKDYLPFLWAYLHASNLLYTKKTQEALALLHYLSPAEKERILLRIDLINNKTDAPSRAAKLILTPGNNEAIVFDLIRYNRRLETKEGTETAIQLFTTHTFLDEEQHASSFWKERNILARRMLDDKRPEDAYKLIKNHGFKIKKETHPGQILCDEECAHAHCMTGWLALKHSKRPEKALGIFQGIKLVVKEAISKARVLYWIGESYLQIKQFSEAKKAFLEASTYSTTFYGQMAASKISSPLLKDQPPKISTVTFKTVLDIVVSPTEKQAFENLELVQIIRSVPEATRIHNCDSFFFALLKVNPTLQFQRQVFDLAESVKNRSYAVLLAKKKHMTFRVAYPLLNKKTRQNTVNLIAPKSQFNPILMPLVHAIIRRESGFDESALSGANAQGMMQLVPATAKQEVKEIKRFGIHFPSSINLYEKIKNIILGTSHIEGRLAKYNGSLILSLADYNAGPKPIQEWINNYGDPRNPDVDIVNWIECIPYYETRNYVQRVLENFMVYQQFLNEEAGKPTAKTLLSYLKR
ncbi:MAG: lytic transglycosylase domain-containing protein [Candidatus Paracaedibacteraceae bacterium]|nr:lytic transglycosylase domain-containing protein [Candidatus Paracaedibacteraceae bacterium]